MKSELPFDGPRGVGVWAWLVIILALAAFNYTAIAQLSVLDYGLPTYYMAKEHGPLEWIQVFALIPGIALCCFAWWRGRGAIRVAGGLIALALAIVLVREVDLDKFKDRGVWLDLAVTYQLPEILLTLLCLSFVGYFFVQRRYLRPMLRSWRTWRVIPFLVAVVLVVAGQFYVENVPVATDVQYWDQYQVEYWDKSFLEEMLETNGYFLFIVAAWQHVQLIGHPDFDFPV